MADVQSKGSEGKYDNEASALLELISAHAVLVIVKGGEKGDGFSVAIDTRHLLPAELVAQIPSVLRSVADAIEAQGA